MVKSSFQSKLRTHVRAPNPIAIKPRRAGARPARRVRPATASVASARHAIQPASGRYKRRSAIIVPMGKRRLDAGNKLRKPKHAKKKAGRERFQSKATRNSVIAMAIQAVQSSRLPRASGISEYE